MLFKIGILLSIFAFSATFVNYVTAEDESWDFVYDEAVELLLHGKNPALAEKKLLIALQQQPNDQHNKRLTYGNRRVNYYPNYFLGIAYFGQKKWNEAAAQFDKVIKSGIFEERDPKYVSALSNYEVALELAAMATKDNLKIGERLATIQNLLQSGQLSLAENEIQLLKRVDPDNKELAELERQLYKQHIEKLLEQAHESFQRGKYEQAARTLDQAREKDPMYPGISELSKKLSQIIEDSNRASHSQQLISYANDRLSGDAKSTDISDTYFSEIRNKVAEVQLLGIESNAINELLAKTNAAEKEYGSFLLREAQEAVAKKNYSLAEELSLKIIRMKLDTSAAKKVLMQIEAPRNMDDTYITIPQDQPTESSVASTTLVKPEAAEEFDHALLTLMKGNYRAAIMEFTALEKKKPSAKIHFYLGCALAGFGFIHGKEGYHWLDRAKVQFLKIRSLDNKFNPHVKYISPRILRFYNEIGPS